MTVGEQGLSVLRKAVGRIPSLDENNFSDRCDITIFREFERARLLLKCGSILAI